MGPSRTWILRRGVPPSFVEECVGLDPVVAKVLYARHVDTPAKVHDFLSGEDCDLHDPMLMADMDRAVARIRQAIEAGERIAVYGDFDVDGVTGTVLMVSVLRELGAHAEPYIPDRFEEGYGLNCDALAYLAERGASLCITVDCGIRSVEEVAFAQARGLDMIITDHHTVPEELPPAVAVVDPKRPDSVYPFRELSGVGVAFQVARALCDRLAQQSGGQTVDMDAYLDLVALGTVADIVPLEGENRALARWGLNRLRSTPRPGLAALIEEARLDAVAVDSIDVAFRLAPRLNAAGRLEEATIAYDLLMATDLAKARTSAGRLGEINRQRQEILEHQVRDAVTRVGPAPADPLLIVDSPDYHEGVVGLVASRLRELYYRPILVVRRNGQTARGSARSVEGFHITEALHSCRDLLDRFGGHEQAAGFTLPTENLPRVRERLLSYARPHLTEEILTPRLLVDAIVSLDELGMATPAALAALGPFGKGNPEPMLATLGVELLEHRQIGREGKHLRLNVRQHGVPRACVAFRQGEMASRLERGQRIDLVYRPSLNHWQGSTSLQLVVEAIRPAARST